MDLSFEITDTPSEEDIAAIGRGLSSFNEASAGPAERRTLAVIVRNGEGQIVAGISGYTAWGWLYVQWLWVAEETRGAGLAGRMLASAEEVAKARGCHGAYIDTFNPHGLHVYKKAGYAVFGELPDFPKGRTRSFLSKTLS